MKLNVPDIAERISQLYSALSDKETDSDIAKTINEILIFGDGVPTNLLSSAWDFFVQKKGVKV